MNQKSRFLLQFSSLFVLFLCVAFSSPCWAGGGQHYPNSAEDLAVGALPPPGVYLKNYLAYMSKDKLMDDSGDEAAVNLDASVFVEVPRIIWVTPYQFFGASYAMHAFFPMYSADVAVKAGGTKVVDSTESGLGDIIFSPFVLGWHFGPQFHLVAALDLYAPTGNYDKDKAATQLLSRNHWTIEPVVAMSYFSGPVDLSVKLMYDFNTKNTDTNTSPGKEFHFDWAAGYGFGNDFTAGLTGFCHWQVSDDKIGGDTVDDERSRLYGAGPVLKWWPGKGRFSATVKYVKEFGGRNIAQGDSTWLDIIWAF